MFCHKSAGTKRDKCLMLLVTIPNTLVSSRTVRLTKRFLSTQAETICGLMCDLHRVYERIRHRGLRFHQLPLRSTAGTFQPVFRPFPAQPERCVHPKLQAHTAREAGLGDQPPAST